MTPLERTVALALCQHRRITRDMPSEAELEHALARAQGLIAEVRRSPELPVSDGKPPVPAPLLDKDGNVCGLEHGHYRLLQQVAEEYEHWVDSQAHVKEPPAAVRKYLKDKRLSLAPALQLSGLYRASVQVRTPPPKV